MRIFVLMANIRKVLTNSFKPVFLEIIDNSHLHAGHFEKKDGLSHIKIIMTSSQFSSNRLDNHRLVYSVLSQFMEPNGSLHAVEMELKKTEY